TPLKVANSLLVHYELAAKKAVVRGKPYVLRVEPTNVCNFQCPGCETGRGDNPIPKGQMKFETFAQVIDRTAKHVVFARLDGLGEPLVNRDIFKMIAYAHKKGVGTAISSNLQLLDRQGAEEIVESGLDYLIVSMDGVTQETYEVYRKGGDLDRLLANFKAIKDAKEEARSKLPFVEIQFIVFKHNRHEIPKVQEMASHLGVDRLLIRDFPSSAVWAARRPRPCFWLWLVSTVGWDGTRRLCCHAFGHPYSLGNWANGHGGDPWNTGPQVALRGLFAGKVEEGKAVVSESCRCYHCPQFPLGR
ncbi:MAG: radical SAM protein, partial [Chloroflexi bacterium]|nr:radical SAM protein [Chloroflexota bacterium]